MADHIEVIKTLTIPDYDIEMCIVSVSGELFVKSPDFDTRIPYCGTLDLDDGVIAVIMADAYEKVLEAAMAEFKHRYACDYELGDLPAMTHSQAHPACDQCNGTGHAGGRCSCTVVGSPVKSNS